MDRGNQVRTNRTAGAILVAMLAVGGIAGCRTPSRRPARQSEIVATSWPRTVADAVDLKLRTMSDAEKSAIRQMARDRVQDAYHGFQMMHRADFGLSEGNDDLLASCGSVRMAAEDCMRIILDALWLALQGTRQ